jgi:hypothetical protein
MSRRVSLRLVTGRAIDEEPEALADEEAQVLDEKLHREPERQPPALGVTPAATASG